MARVQFSRVSAMSQSSLIYRSAGLRQFKITGLTLVVTSRCSFEKNNSVWIIMWYYRLVKVDRIIGFAKKIVCLTGSEAVIYV